MTDQHPCDRCGYRFDPERDPDHAGDPRRCPKCGNKHEQFRDPRTTPAEPAADGGATADADAPGDLEALVREIVRDEIEQMLGGRE